jgi:integrase
MSVKWQSTPLKGVRFYQHPTRKHGVKYDRYYAIRYQKDGQRKEEGCGWASEGWTAEKAFRTLGDLRDAAQKGEPGHRLSERRETKRKAEAEQARGRVTMAKFWEETYLPQAQADKGKETVIAERSRYKKWISPALGSLPIKSISPIHVEKIKSEMAKAGKAARSIQYALAILRQIINEAKRRSVFAGENPVGQVRFPKVDNRRLRFLSKAEADTLLATLLTCDRTVWEMSLLSLHCGLRAGEIFKLTWADIDFDRKVLTVKDSKNGRTRYAFMTASVHDMLKAKEAGTASTLLYPKPQKGDTRREAPRLFQEVVDELGMNTGIEDRRDKVVFHTLRHTFASWLVQAGVDLYRVKELMGHSVMAMTERYAHLAPDAGRVSVEVIERFTPEKPGANLQGSVSSEMVPSSAGRKS